MDYDDNASTQTEQEPTVFRIIQKCHERVEDIARKSRMLLTPQLPKGEQLKGPGMVSELEDRLSALLAHLEDVSSRFKL